MMKCSNIDHLPSSILLPIFPSVLRTDESARLLVNAICCSCHWFFWHLLYFSHFLYPNKKWRGGDSGEEEASSSGDGKYELLSVANRLIAEEIRNVMLKSKQKTALYTADWSGWALWSQSLQLSLNVISYMRLAISTVLGTFNIDCLMWLQLK